MRHFALEGIKKAEKLTERFEIPEDFSISEFLKVPFGLFHGEPITVKVMFDKEVSDYIKRRTWHPSQKIKKLKDGRILLSMTASGKEEIKAWILSFGEKAKVLSPELLRDEIRVTLSRALVSYQTGSNAFDPKLNIHAFISSFPLAVMERSILPSFNFLIFWLGCQVLLWM